MTNDRSNINRVSWLKTCIALSILSVSPNDISALHLDSTLDLNNAYSCRSIQILATNIVRVVNSKNTAYSLLISLRKAYINEVQVWVRIVNLSLEYIWQHTRSIEIKCRLTLLNNDVVTQLEHILDCVLTSTINGALAIPCEQSQDQCTQSCTEEQYR